MAGKKIAVLGGSFSPVHIGHASIAEELVRRQLADEVWLVPCRRNPLKEGMPADDTLRLSLLARAADYINRRLNAKRPEGKSEDKDCRIKVNEVELKLPAPSYTWKTLSKLLELYPDCRFALAIGADSCADFRKWANADWIKRNFEIIVYPRPGYSLEGINPDEFRLLSDVELHDVSSTEIRKTLKEGEDIGQLMPWATPEDINNMKNFYYGGK